MNLNSAQIRVLIHFCYSLGHSIADTHEKITSVYGDICGYSTVKDWFKNFREGRTNLEDEPRSGRPSIVDREAIVHSVVEEPHSSSREISKDLNVSQHTVVRFLKEENFKNSYDRLVPHDLTEAQKEKRVDACKRLRHRALYDNFLMGLVTTDEKWIYLKDNSRKRSWLPAGEHAYQPVQNRFAKKVMLTVFWCKKGLIHYELLENGKTVDHKVYLQSLKSMLAKLREKFPKFGRITFLQDNARPHIQKDVKTFLEKEKVDVVGHPPYSPDLSPSDYHLFRSLQHTLAGQNMKTREEVILLLEEYFSSRTPEFWQRGIDVLQERWQKCIDNKGNYF